MGLSRVPTTRVSIPGTLSVTTSSMGMTMSMWISILKSLMSSVLARKLFIGFSNLISVLYLVDAALGAYKFGATVIFYIKKILTGEKINNSYI
jgi:hypothetical protein